MRKYLLLVSAAAFVFAAGSAGAAPLNWSGTSTVILSDLGDIPLTGGGVATVNGSSGGVPAHLQTLRLKASRGQVGGIATVLVTDPETVGNSIAAVIVDATGGTGTFGAISGAAASNGTLSPNVMPVQGIAKICLLTQACDSFLELPLVQSDVTPNGAVTGVRGVGIGGLLFVGNQNIRISVQANPWTIKTATVDDQITTIGGNTTIVQLTAQGFAHAPGSNTTSTAQPSGVVQLVTPAQVTTNLPFGSSEVLGILLVYTTQFVPEPGILLLLGTGAVGLGLIGRRKIKR